MPKINRPANKPAKSKFDFFSFSMTLPKLRRSLAELQDSSIDCKIQFLTFVFWMLKEEVELDKRILIGNEITKVLLSILAIDPNHLDANYLFARTCNEIDSYDIAYGYFLKVKSLLDPATQQRFYQNLDYKIAKCYADYCYFQIKAYQEAYEAYDRILTSQPLKDHYPVPGASVVSYLKGQCLYKQNKCHDALKLFKTHRQYQTNPVEIADDDVKIAKCYLKLGKKQKALKAVEEANRHYSLARKNMLDEYPAARNVCVDEHSFQIAKLRAKCV